MFLGGRVFISVKWIRDGYKKEEKVKFNSFSNGDFGDIWENSFMGVNMIKLIFRDYGGWERKLILVILKMKRGRIINS